MTDVRRGRSRKTLSSSLSLAAGLPISSTSGQSRGSPQTDGVPRKDELERVLHELVCEGACRWRWRRAASPGIGLRPTGNLYAAPNKRHSMWRPRLASFIAAA